MNRPAQRRIAVAGGYTAGHVLTGVAILKAYREELGADGYFIGCPEGLESRLVPARGEELQLISGTPYARQRISGKLLAPWNLMRGVLEARTVLKKRKTQLVVGVGGYASAGAALAARSLGLLVVIHEANVEPGLANGLLGRLADAVCVGFVQSAQFFPGRNVCLTGTPPGVAVRPRTGPPVPPFHILIAGGSLGSSFLDQHTPDLLRLMRAQGCDARAVHCTGAGDPRAVRAVYEQCGVPAEVHDFLIGMEDAYAGIDFAIACPGAVTLAELAAGGIPSLLVPLGAAANNHQEANA